MQQALAAATSYSIVVVAAPASRAAHQGKYYETNHAEGASDSTLRSSCQAVHLTAQMQQQGVGLAMHHEGQQEEGLPPVKRDSHHEGYRCACCHVLPCMTSVRPWQQVSYSTCGDITVPAKGIHGCSSTVNLVPKFGIAARQPVPCFSTYPALTRESQDAANAIKPHHIDTANRCDSLMHKRETPDNAGIRRW